MAPVYHLCSHIKNAYSSKLKSISVPFSKTNKHICDILYREGFITSLAIGDTQGPFHTGVEIPLTPSNVSSRKIWLDLKYRLGEPALSDMQVISKPSRKVFANVNDLRHMFSGTATKGSLLKNARLGQVTIVKTEHGIMELREALKKSIGGEVLCYAR